jgi:hypothetical protein
MIAPSGEGKSNERKTDGNESTNRNYCQNWRALPRKRGVGGCWDTDDHGTNRETQCHAALQWEGCYVEINPLRVVPNRQDRRGESHITAAAGRGEYRESDPNRPLTSLL